jgi:hypothetical protein
MSAKYGGFSKKEGPAVYRPGPKCGTCKVEIAPGQRNARTVIFDNPTDEQVARAVPATCSRHVVQGAYGSRRRHRLAVRLARHLRRRFTTTLASQTLQRKAA